MQNYRNTLDERKVRLYEKPVLIKSRVMLQTVTAQGAGTGAPSPTLPVQPTDEN